MRYASRRYRRLACVGGRCPRKSADNRVRTYAVALFGIRTLCFSPAPFGSAQDGLRHALRQAQERLRKFGSTVKTIILCAVSALRAETAHKEKIEYRSAACGELAKPKAQQAHCVSPKSIRNTPDASEFARMR